MQAHLTRSKFGECLLLICLFFDVGTDGRLNQSIEDTIMLAVHYARERSVAEYVDLFTQANESYHFAGVTGGKGGAFQSLLEFVFKR